MFFCCVRCRTFVNTYPANTCHIDPRDPWHVPCILHVQEVNMSNAVMIEKEKKSSRADENILSLYLKEINKIPLLTREEEERLARRAAKNDNLAKEKLIRANLRFVVNVAKKYQNQGLPLADLISEG